MSEHVIERHSVGSRRIKANARVKGTLCRACSLPLELGDDAAVCESCGREHHAECWDRNRGCTTPACAYTPFPEVPLPDPEPPPPPPPLRPRRTCPEAKTALVQALIGVLVFAPILEPLALGNAAKAKRAIAADPTLDGEGMATAAQVIAWIVLTIWVITLLSLCSSAGNI